MASSAASSSPEEGWEFASYTRSAQVELLSIQRKIQDSDAQEHSFPGPSPSWTCFVTVDFSECLLPLPGSSEAEEVPQVRLRGERLTNTRLFPLG